MSSATEELILAFPRNQMETFYCCWESLETVCFTQEDISLQVVKE